MAGNTDIAAINLKCKYPEVLDSHYFSDAFFIWGVAPNTIQPRNEIAVIPEIAALVLGHLAPEPASYSEF